MDVIVIGSCNMDLSTYAPRFPKPGETTTGHKYVVGFGGKGANQCVSAARLGCKTAMVGKVGNDDNGNKTIDNFKSNGVTTDYMAVTDQSSTGIAAITIADTGENSIVIVPGANLLLTDVDVTAIEDLIKGSKVVVCQLEVGLSATLETLKLTRKHNVRCILNTAPAQSGLSNDFFVLSDILCANENEAEMMTGLPVSDVAQAEAAIDVLLGKGCRYAIITLGEKGTVFASKDNRTPTYIPATKVKAVDTTGAGDAFVGSLAFYLATRPDLSFENSIQRSSIIASISVQSPGTQYSYPWRKDLQPELFE
ncbi:ribokinase-like [Mytilus trossulus]|uniref:ribokinase-like n=1 Tax=Mytilus trossulus TaxID=6551 RepID=UPI0030046420